MPSLADLVRRYTALDAEEMEWLHLLVADWQLLADLSFSDLILWVPSVERCEYVAIAQMRPTTGPTAYQDDVVGSTVGRAWRPLLDAALRGARIVREGDQQWRHDVPVQVEAIPVRRNGRALGVIARNTSLVSARTQSRLELTYQQCAGDLARMIAAGLFPHVGGHHGGGPVGEGSPRVGDGLLRLDADGRVTYASPNALSAYRRLGLATDLIGTDLGELSAELAASAQATEASPALAAGGRAARIAELEVGNVAVRLRTIPLDEPGLHLGAIVLVRDVTELRRRERELVTKDATIREIHHRVKNNLQTVAALLRMQARRVAEPQAKTALAEAVRRVGSIAIVHDTLALSPDEVVVFDEVVDRVLTMVADVASSAESLMRPRRRGSFGPVPAQLATSLSMVLTELLQNAVEHGLGGRPGGLEVRARRSGGRLRVDVVDDGVGLPAGFELESSANLGLQIVRALVTGEMNGTLTLDSGERGTRASLDLLVEPGGDP